MFTFIVAWPTVSPCCKSQTQNKTIIMGPNYVESVNVQFVNFHSMVEKQLL